MSASPTRGSGPSVDRHTVVVAGSTLTPALDPDIFVPGAGFDPGDMQLQLYDRLMTYGTVDGGDGRAQALDRLEGQLADGHEVLDGGLRHRVTLRPARSAAGNELSADDVVWSWRRSLAQRQVGRWAAFMGSVSRGEDGVQAIDARTVEFHLEQPNALFPHLLTMTVPPVFDSREAQKHATAGDPWATAWLGANACGFGPYSVASVGSDEVELAAREDYYGPDPAIRRVLYRRVPPDARIAALRDGEVDLAAAVGPEEQREAAADPAVELFAAAGNSHVSLQMDADHEPFDDREVRRALAHAVPYQQILDEVYGDAARPWAGVTPDTHNGATSCLTVRLDLEQSRAHLRAAGREQGFSAALYCDEGQPELVAVASRVSASAAHVGLDLVVTPLPSGEFKRRQIAGEIPLAVDQDGHRCNEIGYGLPHDFGDRRHGITNWIRYSSAEVDSLIERAEQEPDGSRREALYGRVQQIIEADTPWAFIAQPRFAIAHRAGLEGLSWQARVGGRPRYAELSWRA